MSTPPVLWDQDEWRAQAHEWIETVLDKKGMALAGPIDQFYVRPWSTVMRVPAHQELLYFKAVIPLLKGEPGLTLAFHRSMGGIVPEVVEADQDLGWMVTADAGLQLRAYLKTPDDLAYLDPALTLLAQLQRDMSQRPEQLITLGAFDRRLESLPGRYRELLEDTEAVQLGQADGLTEEQYQRLLNGAPRYQEMCEELASMRVPQTIHHDDFHDGNIFVGKNPQSFHYSLSDWAESCVTHPFFSIVICLRSASDRVGLPDEAATRPEDFPPEISRLRDVYLQAWEDYEPRERLLRAFNLAWRVAMVNRALTWREVIKSMSPALRGDYVHTVPAWLQEYLIIS